MTTTLRPVRLSDLGWSLTRGYRAASRVVTVAGNVDFVESLTPGAALQNAQHELRANNTHASDSK